VYEYVNVVLDADWHKETLLASTEDSKLHGVEGDARLKKCQYE